MATTPVSADALLAARLLDGAPGPILVVSPDWSIQYCNDAARVLLTAIDAPPGAPLFIAQPAFASPLHREALQRAMLGEIVTFVLARHDARQFWSITAQPVPGGIALFATDITAQLQRTADLEAAHASLSGILNGVVDPILAVNQQFEVVAFNRAYATEFQRLFGTPLRVGVPLAELLRDHPAVLSAALVYWQRAVREGEVFSVQRHVTDRDGVPRVYEVRYGGMRDPGGTLIGGVSTMTDITAQVRDRDERVALTARLDAVIRYSPDRVVAVDHDLRVLAMNEHARADFSSLWGVPITVGDALRERLAHVAAEQRDPALAMWEEAIEGRAAGRFMSFGRSPDDAQAYEISFGALRGPSGEPAGAVMVAKDVSDRERALLALRESEARFRALGDASPSGIFLTDAQGQCTYANPRMQEIWEQRESELRVAGLSARIHPEDAAPVQAWIVGASARQELRCDVRLILSDGVERWVALRGAVIHDDAGEFAGRVGIVDDITESRRIADDRYRMEQQILRAQKLESLEVLAGGIAHDFNNLLVGVLGNASLALLDLPMGAPARAPVVDIERAAQRAADLTRQMLAYSGRGQFLVEPVDLSTLVEEMGALLRTALAKGAVIEFSLPANLPAVEADATQLRQVVMNLITNASDAVAESGGRIMVRTGAQELLTATAELNYLGDVLPAGRYLFVEVEDTGHGMDEQTLSRIFEPFFSTKFTGRGLGLAATLGIVRGHHGGIRIRTAPGEGSVFRVLLPEARNVAVVRAVAPVLHERTAQGTVLIIDDDDTMRVVARRLLERRGYRVLVAPDGEEGVERYQQQQSDISLVLLDLTMPRMGGPATMLALRHINPEVRVLLTSGYSAQEVARQFIGVEPIGFLQKPFRGDELIDAVMRALRPA